jgi:hypothetical protein
MKIHTSFFVLLIAVCLIAVSCAKYESYKSEKDIEDDKKRNSVLTALLPKAQEYANLSFPVQEQKTPVLKLKIALVANIYGETTDFAIKGFRESNGNEDPKAKLVGLNIGQLATAPDEVKTVVRVKCDKGKPLGEYRDSRFSSVPFTYYSSVCELTIFDMEAKATIFRKSYENSKQAKIFDDLMKFGDKYLTPPPKEMEDFLNNAKKAN